MALRLMISLPSKQRCLGVYQNLMPMASLGARNVNYQERQNYSSRSERINERRSKKLLVLSFGIAGAAAVSWLLHHQGKKHQNVSASAPIVPGMKRLDLPSYTMEEVAKHSSVENGGKVWVTYGIGVYDITPFIDQHPGGDKILLAAGGSVEPFWMLYGVHKEPGILAMLEQYRIGNISEEEAKSATSNMEDPYAVDPRRHPALKPSSLKPYNAEPPPGLLVDSFLSPSDLFYVRNHLPVPEVDPATYELEITGIGVKNVTLNLKDLERYKTYSVTAAIQCAGNRRSEMSKVKPVKGLAWGQCAIGNAEWSGPRLYDVLRDAGLKEGQPGVQHVQFEGLDTDPTNVPYGASIPIEKAMDPNGDVILATKMNGQPLSRDHGFPVRVIVPGVVGARNVKWLGKITVSGKESDSHWQQGDYKGFSPSVDWNNVDFSKSPAIQELPVISAICDPVDGESVTITNGKLKVRGYAWSGGGREIIRVDITADKGKTWHVAEFTAKDSRKPPRHWGWTLWTAEVPVEAKTGGEVEIWVKAVDSSYNTQPESFENIWNLRGVLNNAYHRIRVNTKGRKGK
ncbi:sulfite oxidase [Ischnura elegans]|uniref:sulfite oxidase n=1 Tax=Ischnura elegans TaxID=197161 RepID=UPI001ED8A2E4|nr:sulfite oxidase [Ischnura elegans]XP_046386623.1 sulfite oxidase [Ischnura elegans]XP_046386624.1 sulfite oxidase [Ischnura elegans]XP_046386625.1 sulfite oxidase [Ischnura elegans]